MRALLAKHFQHTYGRENVEVEEEDGEEGASYRSCKDDGSSPQP